MSEGPVEQRGVAALEVADDEAVALVAARRCPDSR